MPNTRWALPLPHPGPCTRARARLSRAPATLSREPPGQPGRSPHTRGGAETQAVENQELVTTHRSAPSRAAEPLPGATSPRPPLGRRSRRRRLERAPQQTQRGPAATSCHRQDPLPRLPGRARARAPARAGRARALVSAPPRWLLTPRPPDSQLLVPAPACSLAVARAALPGHAPRPQAASSHVNVHTPPPTPHPLEAECVFSRSPGTSLDLSLSAVPFYVPGDPLSYLNWSSPAFTPSLTLQEPPPQALLRGATSKPTSLWSPQWLASPFIHRPSARWDLRGSTLLTPLHFPQSSAACSGSAHHVGASQRFPRLQRARRDHA